MNHSLILQSLLQCMVEKKEFKDGKHILESIIHCNNDDINSIVNLRGKGKKKVCSASIPYDTLFFKCFQCSDEETHVFCQQCYDPKKHQGHVVTYHYSNGGCCDCGDYPIINKNGFCDNHKLEDQVNLQKIDITTVMSEQLLKLLQQLIQVSVVCLIKEIENISHYPPCFLQTLTKFVDNTNDDEFSKKVHKVLGQLNFDFKNIYYLYNLIITYLEYLTEDNSVLSDFVGKLFLQKIPNEIQVSIPLRHMHTEKQLKIEINQNAQQCNCSLLQLFIKFHIFIDDEYNANKQDKFVPQDKKDFQNLFFNLHAQKDFKSQLCQEICQQMCCLIRPLKLTKYRLQQTNKKISIYQQQQCTIQDPELDQLIEQMKSYGEITKQVNIVFTSYLYEYLYQFMGQLIVMLQDSTISNEFFQCYSQAFQWNYPCLQKSFAFNSKMDARIFGQYTTDSIIYLLKQLNTQLGDNLDKFQNKKIIPSELNLENNFLIQTLCNLIPKQPTKYEDLKLLKFDTAYIYGYSLFVQIQISTIYKRLVYQIYKDTKEAQGIQYTKNLLRIVIKKLFKEIHSVYVINETSSPLHHLLSNIVFSDRNLIILITLYQQLSQFNTAQDFLKDLLEFVEITEDKFLNICTIILKRRIYEYLFYSKCQHQIFYKGLKKVYRKEARLQESSLESYDLQYFQFFCYLFGLEGINTLVYNILDLSNTFKLDDKFQNVLVQISQSDYHLVQVIGTFFQQELTPDLEKAYIKLFKSIFMGQTFYQFTQLSDILNLLSIDSSIDKEEIILKCCVLNEDNQQLQLKNQYQPTSFEPSYFHPSWPIVEAINDRLNTNNNSQATLFGNSLEQELQLNQFGQSTLSDTRLEIIRHIASNEILISKSISVLESLLNQESCENLVINLQTHAVYLNLLFISNQTFPQEKINSLIFDFFVKLEEVKEKQEAMPSSSARIIQMYLSKFKPKENKMVQQNQPEEADKKSLQNNKKKLLQEKFKKKQQNFEDNNQLEAAQGNTICQLCQIPIEDQYCQLLLITITNQQYFNPLIGLSQTILQIDEQNSKDFQISVQSCYHQFHIQCVLDNEKKTQFASQAYATCNMCFAPYNVMFKRSPNQALKLSEIIDLEKFLEICDSKLVEFYFEKYTINGIFQLELSLIDLLLKICKNLLDQLLTNTQNYTQKPENQLFLLDLIRQLQEFYKKNEEMRIHFNNFLNQKESDSKTNTINLILIAYIEEGNEDILLQCLNQYYPQEEANCLIDFICHNKIQQFSLTLFQISDYKAHLVKQYCEFFTENYFTFYLKYGLSFCSLCKFYPKLRLENQKQFQYFCFICKEKMCGHKCGEKGQCKIGNLNNHANNVHFGRALYVNIQTSEILIMISPYVHTSKLFMFQNQIGQAPHLRNDRKQLCEYKLHLKAIQMLVDLMTDEKYLSFIFAHKYQTYKLQSL